MKLSKNSGWASEVIRKYYYAWKLRYTVKRIWAVGVIAKYHAGWKVRKQYRVQLKKHAAPVIVRFFEAVNVSILLVELPQLTVTHFVGVHVSYSTERQSSITITAR